jgi:adenylate cyclase
MRLRRPAFETWLTCGFVVVALAWGGLLGARQVTGSASVLDRLENLTVDWRFALTGPRPVPRGVVVAAIDDDAVREAGRYPLPREVLAKIIRALAAHDVQAVALDLLFLDPGDPQADQELATALRSTRSVVAAVGVFDQDPASGNGRAGLDDLAHVPHAASILGPIAPVRDAARIGLVNVATDHAGIPRHLPMIFQAGNSIMPSFALAAASVALNTEPVLGPGTVRLAGRSASMDFGYHLPIRYYGPRGSIRQFSAARALRGELKGDEVRGQLVLIGATALGVGDKFATPFDNLVPGVEVFATAMTNLLAGDGLVKTTLVRAIDAAAAIVLPVVVVLLMSIRRVGLGLVLAGAAFAIWIAAAVGAFAAGYWLSVAVPFTAAIPVAAGFGLTRLVHDRHAARRLAEEKTALSRFQSPRLVEHIFKNPAFLAKPVDQDVAAVFLDLSGFTGLAEAVGPRWARDLLSSFHALVERDVVAHDGYVVSFMGDGAMIIFGVPEPKPDDAARALLAIRKLHDSLSAWLSTLPPVAQERLSARISGHIGVAVVSLLGAADHQHVTATGDTVNVASRLLEIAKQKGSGIVVSEALWVAAGAAERPSDPGSQASDVAIRGREQPLRIRILH